MAREDRVLRAFAIYPDHKLNYENLHSMDGIEPHSTMQKTTLGKRLESALLKMQVGKKYQFVDLYGMTLGQIRTFMKLVEDHISYEGDFIRICDFSNGRLKEAVLVTTEGLYVILGKDIADSAKYEDGAPKGALLEKIYDELIECYRSCKAEGTPKTDELASFDYDDE